jgi:hypothetical protein
VRARSLVVPPIGTPRLLAREPGAASYYAVGGVRVRFRDGDAVVGEQPFAETLVGAARGAGNEWWFVTASGTVARATDFVGPLRRVERLGSTVVRAFGYEGGLVAVFENGRAWRVGPGGGAQPPGVLEAPEAAPVTAPENEATTVAEAAVARFPAARLALPSSALLASGEVVMQGGDYLYFVAVRADGSLAVRERIALVGEVAGDCALHGWGLRALLTCPGVPERAAERTDLTPYIADPEGVEPAGRAAPGAILSGREGHTLTRRGPCPEEDASGPPPPGASAAVTRACTLDRERGWREWEYPGTATVLDVFESYALISEVRNGASLLLLYSIDAARMAVVPLSDPAVEIARAGFAPDGRIVVLAHSGPPHARRSHAGVARMGTTVVLRPLGFFAQDVAMADGQHGLAVGATANDVAETSDGGLNWLPTVVTVDGDPARVSLVEDERDRDPAAWDGRVRRNGERVQCSPLACRVPGRLVHWWGDGYEVMPAME